MGVNGIEQLREDIQKKLYKEKLLNFHHLQMMKNMEEGVSE